MDFVHGGDEDLETPKAKKYMSEELQPLFVDNHLIVFNKPAGMPVVPDASRDVSLFDLAKTWIKAEFNKPGAVFLGVVHRLDRPVSGVVLFARTSKAAMRLTKAFQARTAKKLYVAVGAGLVNELEDHGEVHQWIMKSTTHNRVRTFLIPPSAHNLRPGEKPKEALTEWRIVQLTTFDGAPATRFELQPLTGRSHQLRVACATLGTPLVGDVKYAPHGARPLPDKSIALHAKRLTIMHPTLKEELTFEAPLPETAWWLDWPDGV